MLTWYETGDVLPITRNVLRFTTNAKEQERKTIAAQAIAPPSPLPTPRHPPPPSPMTEEEEEEEEKSIRHTDLAKKALSSDSKRPVSSKSGDATRTTQAACGA